VYTNGSCYQFYLILKFVYPQANAYYNSDHVITEIDGRYYDIKGDAKKTNHLLMSEHYPTSSVMKSKFKIDIFDIEIIRKAKKIRKQKGV
jgi:hypothetical protein